MPSASRRQFFIKLKGKRPKRKASPKQVDAAADNDRLIGEAAKARPPLLAKSRVVRQAYPEKSTLSYFLLLGGLLLLLAGLFWAASFYGGRPRVDLESRVATASEPRRQIGGDVSEFSRPGTGSGTMTYGGGGAPGARTAPTTEGFLAAPMGQSQAKTAVSRQASLKPGDFRRTTCAVQSGDLDGLSAERLTQCIEDARMR